MDQLPTELISEICGHINNIDQPTERSKTLKNLRLVNKEFGDCAGRVLFSQNVKWDVNSESSSAKIECLLESDWTTAVRHLQLDIENGVNIVERANINPEMCGMIVLEVLAKFRRLKSISISNRRDVHSEDRFYWAKAFRYLFQKQVLPSISQLTWKPGTLPEVVDAALDEALEGSAQAQDNLDNLKKNLSRISSLKLGEVRGFSFAMNTLHGSWGRHMTGLKKLELKNVKFEPSSDVDPPSPRFAKNIEIIRLQSFNGAAEDVLELLQPQMGTLKELLFWNGRVIDHGSNWREVFRAIKAECRKLVRLVVHGLEPCCQRPHHLDVSPMCKISLHEVKDLGELWKQVERNRKAAGSRPKYLGRMFSLLEVRREQTMIALQALEADEPAGST